MGAVVRRAMVVELARRDVTVHGDLADLVPPLPTAGAALDEVTDAEPFDATQAALVSMALAHGELFRRYRRAFVEREGQLPGPAEVLGSQSGPAGSGCASGPSTTPTGTRSWRVPRPVRCSRTSPTSRW